MPETHFYCNWCRERIGTYDDASTPHPARSGLPGGPFRYEGVPDDRVLDHLRMGIVHADEEKSIVAYPCPKCGRNNLLQLPPEPHAPEFTPAEE